MESINGKTVGITIDIAEQASTCTMTAHFVTRRQTKPSQIEAPNIAGTEIKYLNRTSGLAE